MTRDLDMPGGDGDDATARPAPGYLSAPGRWWALLVLGVVVAPSLALTGVLFSAEAGESLEGFDEPVLESVVGVREPVGETVVRVYSALGSPVFAALLTLAAVLGLCVRWRSRTPFLLMAVAAAGSLTMSMTTKVLAARERPPAASAVGELEPSFSFPSGHALNATIIAGVLAYLVVVRTRPGRRRPVAVVAVALAVVHVVLMGLSRVYLGQHWFTDVAVGWAMGLAWLGVVLSAHQLLLRLRSRGPSAPQPSRTPAGAGGIVRSSGATWTTPPSK